MFISKLRLYEVIRDLMNGQFVVESINASAGSHAIPCRIGAGPAPTDTGELYLNSSTLVLTMGNGNVAVPLLNLTGEGIVAVRSGTAAAPTAVGALYYNTSTGALTIGNGTSAVYLGEALNFNRPAAYKGNGNVVYLSFAASVVAGQPVAAGEITGVAGHSFGDVPGPVFTKGEFTLTVKAIDGSGDAAVSVGDKLYFTAADTPPLSKKNTGVFYGYATKAIEAGATDEAATVLLK